MSRRVRLVVNPSSGKGRALALLPAVAGLLRDGDLDLSIELSRDFAEARAMADRAVADGVDVLAVLGGDGLMHVGVNTVARAHRAGDRRTTLGLIPAGTGNDLCRGLGIDPGDALEAARVVAAGHRRDIDLTLVGDTFVATVLATGFDALVNQRANAMTWPQGSSRYTIAALAELRVFSPLHYRLTLDGEVRRHRAVFVAVGNTGYYGGGMQICPQADPYDGWLDVTIIHPVSRLTLLRLLPKTFSGAFASHPCVEQLRVREVTVEGPGLVGFGDGELLGAAPFTACLAPAALPVLVPDAH